MIKAALWYAERLGWSVFPCAPHDKRPIIPNGFLAASSERDQVCSWWERWPNANIGIATGASGLAVIDVDPRHDGDESLAVLRAALGGEMFETVTCLTGGGGSHLFYKTPPGVTLAPMVAKDSSAPLGPGIDLRAGGSYVIAAPSMHESGQKYRWEVGYSPVDLEMPTFPDALIQRLKDAAKKPAAALGEVDKIPEGQRDNTLASLAGTLRRRGLGQDEIYAAIAAVNARRCVPPLPDEDLQRIAKSIARYAPDTPLRAMSPAAEIPEPSPIQPVAIGKTLMTNWLKPQDDRRYKTGLPALDAVTQGLHPGEMTLIGARTGVGKSGFTEQVALEIGKTSSVLFFPLELGIVRTERRMLGKLLKCSEDWVEWMRGPNGGDAHRDISNALDHLQDLKIQMLAPAAGDAFAYGHIKNLILEIRPDVVIIDHLQHIDDWTPSSTKRSDLDAAKITRDLRKLAESNGFHLICVHQLKAEKLQKKQRPQLYDFADTAALPRVADTVLALHRPFRGYPREDNIMETLVLKNRRGPEPWLHTHWVGESMMQFPMTPDEARVALCCRVGAP